MRDSVGSEAVWRHGVLSRVPLDLRLERVDHELAVDVANAASALGDGHLVEGRAEFDSVTDGAAVAAALVVLGAGNGFACCGRDGCFGGHGRVG